MYSSTQVGTDILLFLAVPLVINGIVFATVARRRGLPLMILNGLIAAALVLACVVVSTMTVRVDSNSLTWSLTYDLVRGEIPLGLIRSCTPRTIPRFLGLGYHTNGADSVLLVTGDSLASIRESTGRTVSLGAADPAAVCKAIDAERSANTH